MLTITNEDNMALMARYPDKYFDLAIVDPPYGIDYGGMLKGKGDGNGGIDKNGWKSYNAPDWDKSIPSKEYFTELFRVSKNQIIWGGNYMTEFLPPSMGWLIWDKGQRDFSLADGELAWSSFKNALRIFTMARGKALAENNGGGGDFIQHKNPYRFTNGYLINTQSKVIRF